MSDNEKPLSDLPGLLHNLDLIDTAMSLVLSG